MYKHSVLLIDFHIPRLLPHTLPAALFTWYSVAREVFFHLWCELSRLTGSNAIHEFILSTT